MNIYFPIALLTHWVSHHFSFHVELFYYYAFIFIVHFILFVWSYQRFCFLFFYSSSSSSCLLMKRPWKSVVLQQLKKRQMNWNIAHYNWFIVVKLAFGIDKTWNLPATEPASKIHTQRSMKQSNISQSYSKLKKKKKGTLLLLNCH